MAASAGTCDIAEVSRYRRIHPGITAARVNRPGPRVNRPGPRANRQGQRATPSRASTASRTSAPGLPATASRACPG
ncbi:MAG: hypothetical protein ACRDRJ_52125, partial [Streptosporangiaceae bacterium]